ncbi:MAG: ComEA family DNA-binding protein [Flavobacteriaceae bacterium]
MKIKTAFGFSVTQKAKAVFFMLLILASVQGFFYSKKEKESRKKLLVFDAQLQAEIDARKAVNVLSKIYPFNPNYISDQRAYFLGLSLEETDRLHAYRAKGLWINSLHDFQRVTKVSDTWLQTYGPFFKFPMYEKVVQAPPSIPLKRFDLNRVTAEELTVIKGIGEVLSQRIVKYRSRLDGFSHPDQLDEVYGLSTEVLIKLKAQVYIHTPPKIQKLDLNQVDLWTLTKVPYLSREEAKKVIMLRTQKGEITLLDLYKIENFDSLKIKRLALYLF